MKIGFIIILGISMIGCDIPGRILIINKSGHSATYHTDFREGGQNYEDIHYSISGDKKMNERGIIMGFGFYWTDENINWYADEINRIEIESHRDTIVLKDKQQIVSHFRNNRQGLFKNLIKIEIR